MIFVTTGMHHQGFERLIMAMDEVADQIDETIIMQIGASTYEPVKAEWFRFADQDRIEDLTATARVVVGHAGAGTVISAFRYKRPIVIVPRRSNHSEHVDDHQVELAQALADEGKVVMIEGPTAQSLREGIVQAVELRPHTQRGSRLAAAITTILEQEQQKKIPIKTL